MAYNYIVNYSTSSTGPWTNAGTVSSTSDTISSLKSSTKYWIQVITIDTTTNVKSDPVVSGPFQTSASVSESAQGATVSTVGPVLYDASLEAFGLSANPGQVTVNGTVDTTTSKVILLLYWNHNIYQENQPGDFYYKSSASATWNGPVGDPRTASSPFAVRNARTVLDTTGFNTGGWHTINNVPVSATAVQFAAAMQYCCSRWLRVGINTWDSYGPPIQNSLVSAGYLNPNLKVQLLVYGYLQGASSWVWNTIQAPMVLNLVSGSTNPNGKPLVASIEGPNELNTDDLQSPPGHTASGEQSVIVNTTTPINNNLQNGATDDANSDDAFRGWAQALSDFRSANATALAGIQLISPTFNGYYFVPWSGNQNVANLVDFGTYHSYNNSTNSGQDGEGMPCSIGCHNNNPGCDQSLFYQSAAQGIMGNPKSGMVLSETNAVLQPAGPFTTDGISAARSNMCWFMDFCVVGGKRIMWFELLDDDTNAGGGFGWFDLDFVTPRPSAICQHNLSNIISLGHDYGSQANTDDLVNQPAFTPAFDSSTMTVTVPNYPSGAGKTSSYFTNINAVQPGVLVMPKSDGTTVIAVWNEPTVQLGGTAVTPAAAPVTVNFGSSHQYNVYDISGSGGAQNMTAQATTTPYLSGTGNSVTVNLYGLPVLIELVT